MSLTQPPDSWESGDPYERYVGRWSRQVAPTFLAWLGVPSGRRWLDVGCGTGALCAAIADHCAPSTLVGVEPSEGFLNTAREQLSGRAVLKRGNAAEIPVEDDTVDACVSALVLNFVPDAQAALAEMKRVTASGGTIGAYVWDYEEKMELMRYFWDAAVELDPEVAKIDERARFGLCRPEALTQLFDGAGLHDVAVTGIDIPTRFARFEDYWNPFLGGQGSAPAYAMSLDQSERSRLREHLRTRGPVDTDGSISLIARAWAVRGAVAK